MSANGMLVLSNKQKKLRKRPEGAARELAWRDKGGVWLVGQKCRQSPGGPES